jgi:hypothetical protein
MRRFDNYYQKIKFLFQTKKDSLAKSQQRSYNNRYFFNLSLSKQRQIRDLYKPIERSNSPNLNHKKTRFVFFFFAYAYRMYLLNIYLYSLCIYRTLTYCIWKLMSGDDEQDAKRLETIALPPPKKRRDYNLRMFNILYLIKLLFFSASINTGQHGFGDDEELVPVNAFGIDVSLESEPKHKYKSHTLLSLSI